VCARARECVCAHRMRASVHRDPVVHPVSCLVRACGPFSRGGAYNPFPASIGLKYA